MLAIIKKIIKGFAPAECTSRYLSYKVRHHKNDSLMLRITPPLMTSIKEKVNRLKIRRIYEPEETISLLSTITEESHPCILDIGANIGLMTLNVCEFNSKVKIYAFEPGPKQFRFLKANIIENGLSNRVVPYNVGLGEKNGFSKFYAHHTEHSSGDGFQETGRAGASEIVEVKTETLDSWWDATGRPHVSTIKIDTEGSELLILNNGLELIKKCRPSILIEITIINFASYGLDNSDYHNFFKLNQYNLFGMQGNSTIGVSTKFDGSQSYFIAIPAEKSPNEKHSLVFDLSILDG